MHLDGVKNLPEFSTSDQLASQLHVCGIALGVWLVAAVATSAPMKALIVDGQSNHNWKETTPILEEAFGGNRPVCGRRSHFARQRAGHERLPPDFAPYHVVVLNYTDYDGDDWPDAPSERWRNMLPMAAAW